LVLGISLIFSSFLLIGSPYYISNKKSTILRKDTIISNATIGSLIGLLSGMVGIGGGVFLAPFLHLTNWDNPKKIMATSSLFILVNSISGFVGQIQNPLFKLDFPFTIILMITVFFGGFLGSKWSIKKLKVKNIKFITAILIAIVGVKLIFTHIK
jgi:uncharacterized membrane protein YfcA